MYAHTSHFIFLLNVWRKMHEQRTTVLQIQPIEEDTSKEERKHVKHRIILACYNFFCYYFPIISKKKWQ